MKRIYIYFLTLVLIGFAGFYLLNTYIYNEKQEVATSDYKNAEYVIEGQRIKLEDGVSVREISNESASTITTRYFGNEVFLDLDGDGREDVVFLLTQETGGSGTFYYVVASLNKDEGYTGSQALFLGDRIAPQTTEIGTGKIVVVNYADRARNESMTTPPHIGKSLYLKFDPVSMQFGEVVQDFEGEHNNTDTFARVGGRMGEQISALGITIVVNTILEDSRCPEDVLCVQAGTVRVMATLTSGLGVANQEFRLNETITTEGEEVTLTAVAPVSNSKMTIHEENYTFYFEIKKR